MTIRHLAVRKLHKFVIEHATAGKYPNPGFKGEHDPEVMQVKRGPHRILHGPGPAQTIEAGTPAPDAAFTADVFSGSIATLRNVAFGSAAGFSAGDGGEGALAVDGNFVFATTNYQAAYSTDGGLTWTRVDTFNVLPAPRSPCGAASPTCSPPAFCCDTRAVYVPSINRVVWDIEYTQANATDANVIRLAFASPEQIESSTGTNWSYVDLRSTDFGASSQLLDYGDIVLGGSDLYFSALLASSGGTAMAQLPLSQFASTASGCCWSGWFYVSPRSDGQWYGKYASSTGRLEYFAKQPNTSTLRVFVWNGVTHAMYSVDVPVSSWTDDGNADGDGWRSDIPGPSVPVGQPDTNNWNLNSKIGSRIEGATQAGNDLWFAWASERNSRLPQPYVQMAVINTRTLTLEAEHFIWNPVYAFEYPALASNQDGEVGYIASWGGGGRAYVNEEVGIETHTLTYDAHAADGHGGGGGHYQSIVRGYPNTDCFAAAVDVQQQAADGSRSNDGHFIEFGRTGRPCIPAGFGNPHVILISPETGQVVPAGQPITLSGSASDAVDGTLGGGALKWYVDGNLVGTGTPLMETLQPGDHTVTLQATDSGQRTSSATVAVHVQLPLPVSTSLSLTCPGKVTLGSTLGVTGATDPALSSVPITVTYTYTDPKLGPQTIAHQIVTDAQGNYSDKVDASVAGPWTSQAAFAGDPSHQPSSSTACTTTVS